MSVRRSRMPAPCPLPEDHMGMLSVNIVGKWTNSGFVGHGGGGKRSAEVKVSFRHNSGKVDICLQTL